jgi:hypothetical protein
MMLLAGRHIYGKSHVDLIVETFLDLPGIFGFMLPVVGFPSRIFFSPSFLKKKPTRHEVHLIK